MCLIGGEFAAPNFKLPHYPYSPSLSVDELGQGGNTADQARHHRQLAAMIFLVRNSMIHPGQAAALLAIESGDPLQHVEFAGLSNFAIAFGVRAFQKLNHCGSLV